ncbi:acetylserotonin O-methyltransferase [Kineosporia babensis]|uniref:Acetylserotonin O-methyltransferase n=1 Tax=Kineosporia babensis TaxID=499548 RepID=A0A9X1NH63_9ACTN|nr:acetylserotonin O-methyltransferase [Kineosporia babensis]MCD5314977.1 acetylserotonin O-methyltransferase [Kineosporia babensis]
MTALPPPPIQMLTMLGGFQISQALYSVAKTGTATALLNGPLTVGEIAAATGTHADALGRIVRTLAPLGVFRTEGERVELTALGATLAEGTPGSMRNVALWWMETHYASFGDLLHTVTTGENAAQHHLGEPFFDWIQRDPARIDLQNRTMAELTPGMRAGMLDGYTLPPGAVVADLGGADGDMLARLLAGEPDRRGIVFDRPDVVAAAGQLLAERGLAERIVPQGGDFFVSVPKADVYLLSYVFHDWDDDACLRILRSVAAASVPGARVVLAESAVPTGDEPHLTKMVDLVMLGTMTGRERTAEEYEKLLNVSGFVLDRTVPTASPFSFFEATFVGQGESTAGR